MKTRLLVSAVSLFLASGTAMAWPGDKADTDGDGNISRDEFMQKHQEKAEKMFDKIDADGDGQITAEERKAAREKFKEHHKKRMEKRDHRTDKMHKE